MLCRNLKNAAFAAVALGGVLAAATPSHAQIYSTCARWGSWTQGSWTIYNDVWGTHQQNTCCLYVNSVNSWYSTATEKGGGVKAYPNNSVSINTALPLMKSATASFAITPPSSGSVYDYIFDLWSANSADEIMVTENWTTPTGGWGSQIASNVTIGGTTFAQVWQANPGWNVLMFFPTQQKTSGSEDLLAIMNWCYSQGLLHNNVFSSMPFGVEITSTAGQQNFYVNSYHASWSDVNGNGSSI